MMKRLLVILIVSAGLVGAFGMHIARADTQEEVKRATGKAIGQIYDQLVARKGSIAVFSGLSDVAPQVDELGWPYLEYSQGFLGGNRFYLLIRALPEQGVDYHQRLEGCREFVNTVLKVKLMVYVNSKEALGDFDIYEIVKVAATSVYPESREDSPLKLVISTDKRLFKLGEKIEFGLVLRNESKVALRLRKMDESSISCFFNGLLWGVDRDEEESSHTRDAILLPGEAFRKSFAMRAEKRGPLEIRCIYGLKFRGDQPTASTLVDIK